MLGFALEEESGQKPDSLELQCREVLQNASRKASVANPWFTTENIRFAFRAWASELTPDNLGRWSSIYQDRLADVSARNIAVIMAGNIPLVGMHDFLSVLLCGHKFLGKLSQDDKFLLPAVAGVLCLIEPGFSEMIQFTESRIQGYDAVIATGSNNTARYFEYYFSDKPHIIRKNRNGTAILTGNENDGDLENLADDICLYFGLGCRNVSKIYLPDGFDPARILAACQKYAGQLGDHFRYSNNYIYQKTILQMNLIPYFDNGFLLLREQTAYASPVSVVHYEFYHNTEELEVKLHEDTQLIQCIVSDLPGTGYLPFGSTQHPGLWDYADGVDTMQFLLSFDIT